MLYIVLLTQLSYHLHSTYFIWFICCVTLCIVRPMPLCSVCPSVCLSRSCIVSKWVNIFSNDILNNICNLRLNEVREALLIRPSIGSLFKSPAIIVCCMSTHVNHSVDWRRPTKKFAARMEELTTIQVFLLTNIHNSLNVWTSEVPHWLINIIYIWQHQLAWEP